MTNHLWTIALLTTSLLLAPACATEDSETNDTGADAQDTMDAADDGSTDDGGTGEQPGDDSDSGDAGDESGGADTGDSDGIDLDALYACEESNFVVAFPLTGAGIDPETGELVGPFQDTYVVHTTQLMLQPGDEALARFDELMGPVVEQLMQSEGLVGFSLAVEPTCNFYRTMGIWESEAAMYAFVATSAHADAMAQNSTVSLTGRVHHWEASGEEMPATWESAVANIAAVEPSEYY